MRGKVLMIGLDCVPADILAEPSLAQLPNLRALVRRGTSGLLRSTIPPITVPAWTSMLSGRDPGELGVYGFRNRSAYDYGELKLATDADVRVPRLWDFVGAAGGSAIVVGVPQTFPARPLNGVLVAGFEAEGQPAGTTFPPTLQGEHPQLFGQYRFDVTGFRQRDRAKILAEIQEMTAARFRLMRNLLQTHPWDFAILCEIGPDRLHHCFWSDHDPAHPRHDPQSRFRDVIRDYYRILDREIGELLLCVPEDCCVLVVSDHGAQPMVGGVFINNFLRSADWLVLEHEPDGVVDFDPSLIDWRRTRAWAVGGYYARVFLNVAGREPQGIVPQNKQNRARCELTQLLERIVLPGGPILHNQVFWPEHIYRRVRRLAPDLIVTFQDLQWRSLGGIGGGVLWQQSNDTGVDQANHSLNGVYLIAGHSIPQRAAAASILDVAPTVLGLLGIDAPADWSGVNLLQRDAA